ncbi:hypothetical protein [Paenibacillus durus]|uniref:Uncharacterized protein n=1 Tax=Paenibacillus durus TaxID=44251 RepID=A0A089HV29_PAEDU|nr:hypothetical protein [Paenibacillus durus]AIQ14228.1 hypothetical protein PDUR_21685 [Paenibacillus durus]
MDYFYLKQDQRYTDVPVLQKGMGHIDLWKVNKLPPEELPRVLVFPVKAGKESRFIDFMESPFPLVSDRLMKLMKVYVPECRFKPAALINPELQLQKNYYLPFLEEIEALSPRSEFNLDRSVLKSAVLQEERIRGKKIFKVSGVATPLLVIRLDAAESILRRDFTGIRLERAELDT